MIPLPRQCRCPGTPITKSTWLAGGRHRGPTALVPWCAAVVSFIAVDGSEVRGWFDDYLEAWVKAFKGQLFGDDGGFDCGWLKRGHILAG